MENLENFRPSEAAHHLRVSTSQLWNFIKDGKIKTVKLSKQVTIIRKADLDNFIAKAAEAS